MKPPQRLCRTVAPMRGKFTQSARSAARLQTLTIRTPEGRFTARYSPKGLAALEFPRGKKRQARQGKPGPPAVRDWQRLTREAVLAALAGRKPQGLPPLDLSAGTVFQRRVWGALRRIGFGETRSYTEVARAVGKAGAARAVGRACGANPIPLLVPCHRVLGARGQLGGFSAGLCWKRLLLQREGTLLR